MVRFYFMLFLCLTARLCLFHVLLRFGRLPALWPFWPTCECDQRLTLVFPTRPHLGGIGMLGLKIWVFWDLRSVGWLSFKFLCRSNPRALVVHTCLLFDVVLWWMLLYTISHEFGIYDPEQRSNEAPHNPRCRGAYKQALSACSCCLHSQIRDGSLYAV